MKLNIATAQYPITAHQHFEQWQEHTADWVAEGARLGAKLLLFPEYGSLELLSFHATEHKGNVRKQLQAMDRLREDFCQTFADLAAKHQLIIVAPSFPVLEEGKNLNRTFVFSPAGISGYQDKFFLTQFEKEEWGMDSAPKVLRLFEAEWGSFGIQICYDMEFSLGSKILSSAGASLILTPSCTENVQGSSRVHIGARARALEAQAYTVVSQTVGPAPWFEALNKNYGYTAFYCSPNLDMPERGIISKSEAQTAGWLTQTLDFEAIDRVRKDARVLNYKDQQRFYSDFPDEEIRVEKVQI